MTLITAKSAGFCRGVRRAVRLAEEAAAKGGTVVTLGPLIHNRDVTDRLEAQGVRQVETLDEVPAGAVVIIRSHGIGRAEWEKLRGMDCTVVDATCPDVESIHRTVTAQEAAGRQVLIFGQPDHPEVRAIAGWCGNPLIVSTDDEISELLRKKPELRGKPISLVSQTTANRENFEKCVNILKKQCTNLEIFDTICNATCKRQTEAAQLAQQCDAMIVIGGKSSANSRRLAEVCSERCSRVYFIENASELDAAMLSGAEKVGITAGASTPQWIIKEVNHKMSDEIKIEEPIAEAAAAEPEAPEAAPAVAEEAPAEQPESFEEMLEKSIRTLSTGDRVKGIVAAITPTEISVDLGTKQSGYIPVTELSDDPAAKVEDIVKIGSEIECFVVRVNDVEGTVQLSKKHLDAIKNWDDVQAAAEAGSIVEGKVVEDNKGGVVVSVKGVRVFVPASRTGLPMGAAMSEIVGNTVRLKITEVGQGRRKVVGSIRDAANAERKERAAKIWGEIEVGKEYKGVVKSLTSYGAFVDIGGIDGMVHVSELSWKRVRQPSDILKVGDELDVFVLSFDPEKKKISLGHKKAEDNPWFKFNQAFKKGDDAEVKIVKLMNFGAFAEVMPGVDGLIHISQIADHRIEKPEDVLQVGQVVTARIIDIDQEKQKISLSIRALLQQPKEEVVEEEEEASDSVVYDTDHPNKDYE